ncbi:MAG TPA: RNA-guided pseudouridylation complex pseudouridine synthase subunit Cbf5 [Nitrososphaeraceae archaeon]|jgi:H/ACA ribonucleoprotein complex subunit 4|nr:RNA-guided pseudouridylation complex pseudouridine synthase subunit Cbf5 [Nitrososphaeraceae archaeon]
MTLKLDTLEIINNDVTNNKYGHYPNNRPLDVLLDNGIILLDKPSGPTSHELVAWTKRILGITKAGHSGTLDPGTTGLLPIGLGDATKALSVLLLGPKEYYAIARIHQQKHLVQIDNVLREFTGEIYQRPPQRSSVKRSTRVRRIYEIQRLESVDNILLVRVLCEAGTYIRKLVYDIGEVLGTGATMFELRRTRVSVFSESAGKLVRLHDLVDAIETYKETKEEEKIRSIIKPIEMALEGVVCVAVKDSAVDALCHGAQVAIPGIVAIDKDLRKGNLVGIYTLKGEIIALGEANMNSEEIRQNEKGIAFNIKRLIMKPDTYPRGWKTNKKE